jgi:hypothetical protein
MPYTICAALSESPGPWRRVRRRECASLRACGLAQRARIPPTMAGILVRRSTFLPALCAKGGISGAGSSFGGDPANRCVVRRWRCKTGIAQSDRKRRLFPPAHGMPRNCSATRGHRSPYNLARPDDLRPSAAALPGRRRSRVAACRRQHRPATIPAALSGQCLNRLSFPPRSSSAHSGPSTPVR